MIASAPRPWPTARSSVQFLPEHRHLRQLPCLGFERLSLPLQLIQEHGDQLLIPHGLHFARRRTRYKFPGAVGDIASGSLPGVSDVSTATSCDRETKLRAESCLVVEDSRNGLLAAKAAGMTCAAIPCASTRHQDFRAADYDLEMLWDLCALL